MTGGVRCMLMRGGTSKGAYFLAGDLPGDPAERDDLLLRIMGSPDPRQIDGIGGAHPLTSKVAVISPSSRPDADVDYLFLQVGVDQATVSDQQNCGNLLAGVGPFAIERGLAAPVPKISLVAAPADGGTICTRTFIPVRVHESIGVLGAVSVATALLLGGAAGAGLAAVEPGQTRFGIEHPSGHLEVEAEVD